MYFEYSIKILIKLVLRSIFLENYLVEIEVNWLCFVHDFLHVFPQYTAGPKTCDTQKTS